VKENECSTQNDTRNTIYDIRDTMI